MGFYKGVFNMLKLRRNNKIIKEYESAYDFAEDVEMLASILHTMDESKINQIQYKLRVNAFAFAMGGKMTLCDYSFGA